jgi:hypothetical protein
MAEEMAGDNVPDVKLASGFVGVGVVPGKTLGHAEGADAESWRVAERGDDFIGQGGAEVFELGVVRGILKRKYSDGGLTGKTGRRGGGAFVKEKAETHGSSGKNQHRS